MNPVISNYINFRYPNWHDYAKYIASQQHFEGWEDDLLNDVLIDLLKNPEERLLSLIEKKTRKIVNGKPTTELDKFVLTMLKINGTSKTAPFRKNTLGKKIISRKGGEITTIRKEALNGSDFLQDEYNAEHNRKIEMMHARNLRRLENNGFTTKSINLYKQHYIECIPYAHFKPHDKISIQYLQKFLCTSKTMLDD
jgi:hypothetical protein